MNCLDDTPADTQAVQTAALIKIGVHVVHCTHISKNAFFKDTVNRVATITRAIYEQIFLYCNFILLSERVSIISCERYFLRLI